MIDRQQLLKDLQALLPKIEQDILAYTESKSTLDEHLQDEYRKAKEANRTAEHFVAWREAQITQAAAAWLLSCVFIRFLEDNRLLSDPLIAGPTGNRLQLAKDRITVYFRDNPTHAERDYLLSLFGELDQLPAMTELLDRSHNPLWQLPVSADGAKALIDFFQRLNPESGNIIHDFTDPNWDTRFLGDLYQDLSESVRKRYALLQTPEFVESFILDYTLEKAKDTFGLPGLRLIDPTCGSGHFLLTTFERLFNDWVQREPATNSRALAQRALDSVHGVDINPYAIAIARFRLLIAAMKAAGSDNMQSAPDFHFNLAVGDSLLHGPRHEWQGQGLQSSLMDDPIKHVLEVEDKEKLEKILGQRYHVVVGNPPYITVKDKALNQAYRDKYPTCHRQYSMGVPFTERFFDLTLAARYNHPAGYMGMITTNSFMKREFGKKLIEEYLPHKELTHVIDTSGAYIPGHGTPTVILFARNSQPQAETLRAVLGIRGEPSTPDNPAQGKVWRSIVNLIESAGSENDFVSIVDQVRELYGKHPWSVSGGGATELKVLLESHCETKLDQVIDLVGFICMTRADDIYFSSENALKRLGIEDEHIIQNIEGNKVRDWNIQDPSYTCFPYDKELKAHATAAVCKYLWPHRSALWLRREPNGNHKEIGLTWFEWSRFQRERFRTPLSIAFACIATHNHFVLDRGGKVFKQSAPVIKLPAGSTEADHLALLGLLNSSTGCFWIRQVTQPKTQTTGMDQEQWRVRRDLDSTKLKAFPIPEQSPVDLATMLDRFAQERRRHLPEQVVAELMVRSAPDTSAAKNRPGEELNGTTLRTLLDAHRDEATSLMRHMIALQEELDWRSYKLFGLTDEDLCYGKAPPEIQLGQRPFELHLAHRIAAGEIETTWFQGHYGTPIADIPDHWPEDYRELTLRRLQVIQENRWIKLVEQPENKRRWHQDTWNENLCKATREWLQNHLETLCHEPELITSAQLADRARQDANFEQVAALYTGSNIFDHQTLVEELVAADNVPQMAAARLKPKAMPKYHAWQETWDKQRAEDAIDARSELPENDPDYLSKDSAAALKAREVGTIPLPPKYASGDFRKPSYWSLRGKLDVPKERFFSLPHCEKAGDSTLVIGWAGLDHLQRAQAIAAWYLDRKEQDGWDGERLKPMLVALDELVPWLKQWHNDIDPEFGERLGDYYEGFLLEELRQLDIAQDELLVWEPPVAKRRTSRKQV